MSSSQESQESAKATRGTYLSLNGRELYVETYSLESIRLNAPLFRITSSLFNRIMTVFLSTQIDPSQVYIMLAYDYIPDKKDQKDMYKLVGFWNPKTQDYEFEQQ